MIKLKPRLIWMSVVPLLVVLATSNCATKKYVSQQIHSVDQRMSKSEKQTNDRIAWLNNKQQTDMSAMSGRLDTTDQKVAETSSAAQEAQGSASRAMEASDTNKTAIADNSTEIAGLKSNMSKAFDYQLIDSADIMFGFNQATLTSQAKKLLDEIVSKAQSNPRTVIELAGFTDPRGTPNYNLSLSRRRAWAVQEYLIEHNVPSRSIHMVGLGEGAPPEAMAPESAASASTRAEKYQLARRVHVKVFTAGETNSASRSDQ